MILGWNAATLGNCDLILQKSASCPRQQNNK